MIYWYVIPGPDVAIANNDHEDIENTRESEMIEAAMNLDEHENERTQFNEGLRVKGVGAWPLHILACTAYDSYIGFKTKMS